MLSGISRLARNNHHSLTLPFYASQNRCPQMSSFETLPPDLPTDSLEVQANESHRHGYDLYTIAFERSQTPMIIASVGVKQNPIVLANQAFLDLTGYSLPEVVGRDCRFLQGPATSKQTVAAIGSALRAQLNVDVALLNYRKDGSEFWNQLHISPIRDDQGDVIYYFASQIDVTETRRVATLEASERRLLREVDHRTKNVTAVVNSIVRLSRSEDPERYAASVRERVQTLADVHTLLAEKGWRPVPLGQLIHQQFKSFKASSVRLAGQDIAIDATDAQPIALIIHELAANATAHGALACDTGTAHVEWRRVASGGFEIEWRERGGAVPASPRKPGFGTVIVDALVQRQLRGSIERDWGKEGLALVIRLPGRSDIEIGRQ